jgi:hypothetical protein
MYRLALQSLLHGFCGFIGEGKEPMCVITIIGANDQMVIGSKDVDCRLDFNKLKKLIKDK